MELKQLNYFITVAEEGSFLRAAKRLNISQPALSIAIKNLEEEIGAPLFYSFGRKRELTDDGQNLLEDARELMQVYQRTLDNVKLGNQNMRGTIRLGLPPLFGACFFGNLIPTFMKRYPNIKIKIVEECAIRAEEMVQNDMLDIALTLRSERIHNFESCHFTTQRNLALLHKDHPLSSRETLTVSDLRDESFATFNESFILHQNLLTACRVAGFFPKFSLLTSQWDFMVEMVAQQQGVAFLPKPIYELSAKKSIVAIPLVDSLKYWDIMVIWNKNRYFSKPCSIFLEHIRDHLPEDDVDNDILII